jgi:hypothetical protein
MRAFFDTSDDAAKQNKCRFKMCNLKLAPTFGRKSLGARVTQFFNHSCFVGKSDVAFGSSRQKTKKKRNEIHKEQQGVTFRQLLLSRSYRKQSIHHDFTKSKQGQHANNNQQKISSSGMASHLHRKPNRQLSTGRFHQTFCQILNPSKQMKNKQEIFASQFCCFCRMSSTRHRASRHEASEEVDKQSEIRNLICVFCIE